MRNRAVVVTTGGVTTVAFSDPDVEVVIIDLDNNDTYLYKEMLCKIISVGDDGTVDLKCIDESDGRKFNRRFMGVPIEQIEYYGSDDDLDIPFDEEGEE